jgi:hypothetical protein
MILTAESIATTFNSFASEVLKADGHPEILTRVHIVLFACMAVGMLALLPLGFYGICAGVAGGSLVAAIYPMWQVKRLNSFGNRELIRESAPPLVASLVMAAVLVPLQFLVVQAETHGTALGLVLLIGEGLLGLLIFIVAMLVLQPSTIFEVRDLGWKMIRSRTA